NATLVFLKRFNKSTPENSGDFVIEILEELEMGADQTKKSFKEDLEILKKMWQEKLAGECFY
ncbi:MAG: hypothetical protein L6276_12190, partial [Acetobacterium sp.]|nr:hypothetical protein [Acetobacterium sp.]